MKISMKKWMLLVSILLVAQQMVMVVVAQEEQGNEEETSTKRLGLKKKKVGEKLYASYGLSPQRGDPQKVVDYSKKAVRAASSNAKSISAGKKRSILGSGRKRDPNIVGEPPAPGCQAKVDLRPFMTKVEDQSASNSCAANAVAGAYEYLATRAAIRDGEKVVGDISRLFIYYVGRKRDQIHWGEDTTQLPRDEGMTLHGAIEAVQKKGAALQSAWPFDLNKVNHRPSEDAFSQAMRYKVGDAMRIPLDLDKMRQCLNDGYPIIFGLKLTANFFMPPHDGFIPTPDPTDPQSAQHGLHAMLIVGYNDRQRVFIIRNSWGSDWGSEGYCYLSYDYVANSEFNFGSMYAIQSLTDDDLTPDDDDGHDMDQHTDPSNITPDNHIWHSLEDVFEDGIIDESEEMDAEDMFSSMGEARRAFLLLAGNTEEMGGDNLQLSREELSQALLLVGIPMVTDAELDMAMKRYDDDKSGYITLDEFMDMQEFFDGSLLRRQRNWYKVKKRVGRFFNKIFSSSGSSSSGDEAAAAATEL